MPRRCYKESLCFAGDSTGRSFRNGRKEPIVAPSMARSPGSGVIRYDYGTIAVTSLEYALSWLEEFKAVTT